MMGVRMTTIHCQFDSKVVAFTTADSTRPLQGPLDNSRILELPIGAAVATRPPGDVPRLRLDADLAPWDSHHRGRRDWRRSAVESAHAQRCPASWAHRCPASSAGR
jgi:hypothetical protein